MIPVLNKIDLPNAEPERIAEQIEDTFGLPRTDIISVSAKKGINVEALLPAICTRIPPYVPRSQSNVVRKELWKSH
jgi:GTP-binding protein LepA